MGGKRAGNVCELGLYMRKRGRLFLERASARTLSRPLIWQDENIKLNFAETNERHLIRCIKLESRTEPWLMSATTAVLSV